MNWSTADLADFYKRRGDVNPLATACGDGAKPEKPMKYRSRAKEVDGIIFDSCREARRYQELKIQQAAGAISDLQLQRKFMLQEGFRDQDGKWVRPITYLADFSYYEVVSGQAVVEDVKSHITMTPAFRIKWKLAQTRYPAYRWRTVT